MSTRGNDEHEARQSLELRGARLGSDGDGGYSLTPALEGEEERLHRGVVVPQIVMHRPERPDQLAPGRLPKGER
jgi:hypothetical protein